MSSFRRAAFAALVSAAMLPGPAVAQAVNPRDVVDRVDRLLRGASSRGSVSMQITTRQWSRRLDMDIWSLGTDYALVRVTGPAREKGTATLKVRNDVWNYLPRVDRTIRIPPSLMAGSWMGSHFTNDDLVKETRLVSDYDVALGHGDESDGVPVWDFELTPKPDAPVVWGRIEMRVRRTDLMPVYERYYDDAGRLSRTITFSRYTTMGGRLVPAVLTVTPADKPDEHTVLTYRRLEFDADLQPGFFSLQNLRGR